MLLNMNFKSSGVPDCVSKQPQSRFSRLKSQALLFSLVLAAVLGLVAQGDTCFAKVEQTKQTGLPKHSASVQQSWLKRRWQQWNSSKQHLQTPGLAEFVLEAAAAEWHPELTEKALEWLELLQDRNPESRTFGNFRWYWENERPIDLNAVEFCLQKLVLVQKLFSQRLTQRGRAALKRLLKFGAEGVRRHRVPVSYTNIYLMKSWNCIAVGEALGRRPLADQGYRMLERWLIFTWENGVREYISPCYYGVDLDSLALIARFAERPEGRKNAEAALRLLWTDIAANWFAPCARLGGPHSRDYDYLTGRGYLDHHLQTVGWVQTRRRQQRVFFQLCEWRPNKSLWKPIWDQRPRLVLQRWGREPGQTSIHYVGSHFDLGSAGANYGPLDKPLVVNLGNTSKTPQVMFFMDGRGDPYGKKKEAQRSGHLKALHLTPFVARVQRGPEVLFLASADPTKLQFHRHQPKPKCLLSHLVVPAEAELWSGEQRLNAVESGQRFPLSLHSPVFLRLQDVAVGIQWLAAWNGQGQAVPLQLVNDGEQFHARRFTCVHYQSDVQAGESVVVLWLRAAEGLDDSGFRRFRRNFSQAHHSVNLENGVLTAEAEGLDARLLLKVDLQSRRILKTQGTEPDDGRFVLAVNGKDRGRSILEQRSCVADWKNLLEAAETGARGTPRAEQVVEAEQAVWLTPPFEVARDTKASAGRFVWVPGKPGEKKSGAPAWAEWLVHVPKTGRYRLWGRVRTPTSADDSFYVSIQQAGRTVLPRVDWHTGVHQHWTWTPVTAGLNQKPISLQLKRGAVRVKLWAREDGAALDSLILTSRLKQRPQDLTSKAQP